MYSKERQTYVFPYQLYAIGSPSMDQTEKSEVHDP